MTDEGREERNRIEDQSADKEYFIITPQLVWALCRDPYDFTLWCVIKMIAGEEGECYLSTPDLAELAMMSMGKVSNCRQYLLDQGLLEGECRRDPGYQQAVWHLRVPNIWEDNIVWRRGMQSLKERLEYKKEQRAAFRKARRKKKLSPDESSEEKPSPGESLEEEPSPGESSTEKPSPDESLGELSPGEREPSPGEKGTSPGETKKNHKKHQTKNQMVGDGDGGSIEEDERVISLIDLAQDLRQPLDLGQAHAMVQPYTLAQIDDLVTYARQAKGLHDPLAFVFKRLRTGELPILPTPEPEPDYTEDAFLDAEPAPEPEPVDRALVEAREIWRTALGEMQLQMTRDTFNTWLKPTEVIRHEDGVLYVEVENKYVKDWLSNRLAATITRTVRSIAGETVEVKFVSKEERRETEDERAQ